MASPGMVLVGRHTVGVQPGLGNGMFTRAYHYYSNINHDYRIHPCSWSGFLSVHTDHSDSVNHVIC